MLDALKNTDSGKAVVEAFTNGPGGAKSNETKDR
jgi:hypothetical protein